MYAGTGIQSKYYQNLFEKKKEELLDDIRCPKCGKPMIKKTGKNGKKDFYACSGFPKCRSILSEKDIKNSK